MQKKKKGFIDSSIMFILSIFFMSVLFVVMIKYLQPIMQFINLNAVERQYILKMEKDGYLTPDSKQKLIDELKNDNFDTDNITITATQAPVDYGQDVSLEIKYIYKLDTIIVDGLNIKYEKEEKPMDIRLITTSKNTN